MEKILLQFLEKDIDEIDTEFDEIITGTEFDEIITGKDCKEIYSRINKLNDEEIFVLEEAFKNKGINLEKIENQIKCDKNNLFSETENMLKYFTPDDMKWILNIIFGEDKVDELLQEDKVIPEEDKVILEEDKVIPEEDKVILEDLKKGKSFKPEYIKYMIPSLLFIVLFHNIYKKYKKNTLKYKKLNYH